MGSARGIGVWKCGGGALGVVAGVGVWGEFRCGGGGESLSLVVRLEGWSLR